MHPAGLSVLFGVFYFIQGITEPTEGLISQPVQSLLKSWGQNAEQISTFAALLALPWSIKPLYGLISDFIPLAGYHRKSYLIVSSAIAAASLGALYSLELVPGDTATLLALLIFPTIGVAFCDVVIDALMIAKGQPLGLTGRFQSIQWGAIWAASILTGTLGGYLSAHAQQQQGFLICAVMMLVTLLLALVAVREDRAGASRESFASTGRELRQAIRSPTLLAVGDFLFLWSFNPFSNTVLYLYMTQGLELGEQFYGDTQSLYAVAAMLGSLSYSFYCRRVPMRMLVHLSIVLGVASTLAHWLLRDESSARLIRAAVGFTQATAIIIQLDLAARVCPPRVAATLFALLMSLSNLAEALSTGLGGWCYQRLLAAEGNPLAFNVLVGIGAAFTAGCWLVMPFLHDARSVEES